MSILALVLAGLVLAVAGAVGWQNLRYLRSRRMAVQDQQAQLPPAGVFHTVTFLKLAADGVLLDAVRQLRSSLEAEAGTRLVYAGQTVVVALPSSQLPPIEWDGVLVVQHPSRADYEKRAATPEYQRMLAPFADSYTHGFERPRALSLILPVMLLGLRIVDIVTRADLEYPFVPAEELTLPGGATGTGEDRLSAFEGVREHGRDAVVIVNLLKGGTPEEKAADRAYGRKMGSLFALGAHGPIHMGRAVTLEGDADFDQVAIVYYPGVDYFMSLMRSTYFNRIVGGKQLGDTLAVPTVPILGRL